MRRAKLVRRRSPSPPTERVNDSKAARVRRRHPTPEAGQTTGLRERKKARLRQQIVETSLHLFRQHGYENTRIDDIVQSLEISQPTFFRYFPSKDAVLREVGRRAFARQAQSLKSELSTSATTEQRLRRFYETLGNVTEVGRPLWQAVIIAGAMDPVRSPELRGAEATTVSLLREIIAEGQKKRRDNPRFPGCTPGRIYGRTFQHRSPSVGRRSYRTSQTHRASTKCGRIFLARSQTVAGMLSSFSRSPRISQLFREHLNHACQVP
jgi:AcrR family transcriptional regulator